MVIARAEAVRLAKRVLDLDEELAENVTTTTALIKQSAARVLLDRPGIGPVTAAVAMAAWSHAGRLSSEAAFASLAGVSPIPASSGNTVRHRLNRGGHRRLNTALHMTVVVRRTHDAQTKAYGERRVAEGLTQTRNSPHPQALPRRADPSRTDRGEQSRRGRYERDLHRTDRGLTDIGGSLPSAALT